MSAHGDRLDARFHAPTSRAYTIRDRSPELSYCGCCGRHCSDLWCSKCTQHVLTTGALWDRTYFAQHGVDCPFQAVPADPPEAQP